jgi:murein DD-endopeptidase MepM/ murein hydrolase activator NlpD
LALNKANALTTLADPVKGARVSSGFGWRIHPILGGRSFHYGIDLAAPSGTPIHAAGDGLSKRPVSAVAMASTFASGTACSC